MVYGPTDGGQTPEHGYTISSPGEPNSSGELNCKHKNPLLNHSPEPELVAMVISSWLKY